MSSANSVINQTSSSTFHQLTMKVKNSEHAISIIENGKIQYTSCSCSAEESCEHILRVLAGHQRQLDVAGKQTQKALLISLNKTEDGRKAIARATQIFPAQKPSWLKKQVIKGKRQLYSRLKKWLLSDELD